MSTTTFKTTKLSNGVEIFYRESGCKSKPILLLLHGFPSSSRQYAQIIPLLNDKFHIIAPDLPAFGQTKLPEDFNLSFDALAETVSLLLDELKITKFSVYVFDYGAPVGFRLALDPKYEVSSIISQNGNAYEDALQEFWDPLRIVWELVEKPSLTPKESSQLESINAELTKLFLTYEPYHSQYFDGEEDLSRVDPEGPVVDFQLLSEYPNTTHNQLTLFTDYRNNVKKYPVFHQYFRTSNVPILVIWGVNDFIFPKAGQEAFKRDSKNVKLVDIPGGHFAGISHAPEVAENIVAFAKEYNII
ncbi:hypothetical protein PSN45_004398 [Yamadazyma tenuis]|uniref:AB hydrolase-1 domain-containing protein n=1 Tax=Candida tenuis (strain ATCC 10573 / BCRC 21748 / CBS 615 / JCM 9827 / NBRC 10315 / NRRL Y-1498 / VKM Y-70) TaxID=590646 RepID=G3B5X5_CANTC|nr:uncharacterized protein CANTEDRAFT_114622 [Yamadazyma tenuis ATCC 10573]EGV63328.1 hypothetical protein CANTEDRAFT_114622 [Yamadazyma tenuis ATCC 10573]WEJ96853.1 hypothetical protein PSN45_004398 [Yamadazyma tenuis]